MKEPVPPAPREHTDPSLVQAQRVAADILNMSQSEVDDLMSVRDKDSPRKQVYTSITKFNNINRNQAKTTLFTRHTFMWVLIRNYFFEWPNIMARRNPNPLNTSLIDSDTEIAYDK